MERSKKVLLIVNPKAGQMTFRNSFYPVVKRFSDAGYEVTVHFTARAQDATEKILACGEEYGTIVACGGDGTFNEAVNGAIRLKTPVKLCYIPCGSTNDFASTLGITGTPSQVAESILADRRVSLDLGKFNDRCFTYTASFGAFTAISYDTPQNLKNALGHFAYMLNSAKQIVNLPRVRLQVQCDDYTEEGTYIYGGVTNTTSIGGVYTLPDEEVVLDDGRLELLLIREPKHPQEYAQTLLNLAVRNYDDPNILFRHGKEFRFTSKEEVAFTLDGEFGGSRKENTIVCLPRAYSVNGSLENP